MSWPIDLPLYRDDGRFCPPEYVWLENNCPSSWTLFPPGALKNPVSSDSNIRVIVLYEIQSPDSYGITSKVEMFDRSSDKGRKASQIRWDEHPFHYDRVLAWQCTVEFEDVLEKANSAFWDVVAGLYPGTKYSKISPAAEVILEDAQRRALSEWITS